MGENYICRSWNSLAQRFDITKAHFQFAQLFCHQWRTFAAISNVVRLSVLTIAIFDELKFDFFSFQN